VVDLAAPGAGILSTLNSGTTTPSASIVSPPVSTRTSVVRTGVAPTTSACFRAGGGWLPMSMNAAMPPPRTTSGTIQPRMARTIFMEKFQEPNGE
jgi:hypothetical protein